MPDQRCTPRTAGWLMGLFLELILSNLSQVLFRQFYLFVCLFVVVVLLLLFFVCFVPATFERLLYSRCFTPSQPVWFYRGEYIYITYLLIYIFSVFCIYIYAEYRKRYCVVRQILALDRIAETIVASHQ